MIEIYVNKGIDRVDATLIIDILSRHHDVFIDSMMIDELGMFLATQSTITLKFTALSHSSLMIHGEWSCHRAVILVQSNFQVTSHAYDFKPSIHRHKTSRSNGSSHCFCFLQHFGFPRSQPHTIFVAFFSQKIDPTRRNINHFPFSVGIHSKSNLYAKKKRRRLATFCCQLFGIEFGGGYCSILHGTHNDTLWWIMLKLLHAAWHLFLSTQPIGYHL